jgi:predicted  nucleic acid-binding Zn ribbon protein
MKQSGYCPHCGSKVTEVINMGYFDEFTFKCWKCQRIVKNLDVVFSRGSAENKGTIDLGAKI